MRRKHNEGFSLIEILVSIVVLALVIVPVSTSMVMSCRMNAKVEAMMQAQLEVSSAVEILMAEGITKASESYGEDGDGINRYGAVRISTHLVQSSGSTRTYEVIVTSDIVPDVVVKTFIRGGASS